MPDTTSDGQPLSELLAEMAERPAPRVSVAELMDSVGHRALGALLLVFGLICTLPLPPGGTTVFGLPLLLLAPQLTIGRRAPWLPRRMRRRSIRRDQLRHGLDRVLPWLKRIEGLSRPRLGFLFAGPGRSLLGLVCTVFALVLILPIPLGNMLPAAAVSLLSLSLVQRDGFLALAGYAVAAASVGVLTLAAGVLSRSAQSLFAFVSAA
jgi:hypothetical protein